MKSRSSKFDLTPKVNTHASPDGSSSLLLAALA
jgi:hypothetical protein